MIARVTKIIGWLLVAGLIGFTGLRMSRWMQQSQTFTLQEIAVSGNHILSTEEILELMNLSLGVRITDINLEEIQHRLEGHPYIETALVSRRFPNTLQVEVVERVPVAFLTGRKLYAVDRDGVLLPVIHSGTLGPLPVINGLKGFTEKVGAEVGDERLKQALELLRSIRLTDLGLYRDVSEVKFTPQKGFVVFFNDAAFPVYFGFGDFLHKARKTQAFFAEVKKERRYKKLRLVDLRYSNQVVAKFR